MRISRIRIGSFGGVVNRTYEVPKDMAVFYGPNESGKTTTMEFIRTVLSPSKKKNRYPEKSKSDSGSLVLESDGVQRTLELQSKVSSRGDDPLGGMDPELYRKIFAMDPEELGDSSAIARGDIKSRFLTIPGGSGVPSAIDWADKEVKDVIGLRSSSPSKLNEQDGKIRVKEEDVARMKASANAYGDLASQKAAMEAEIAALKAESVKDEDAKRIYQNYENNRGNYKELAELKARRASLGSFVPATEDDLVSEQRLISNHDSCVKRLEEANQSSDAVKQALGGIEPSVVMSREAEISDLQQRFPRYREDRAALWRIPEPEKIPEAPSKSRSATPMLVLGVLLVVAGLVGALVSLPLIVLSAAGAIAVVASLKRRDAEPAPQPVKQEDGSEAVKSAVSKFESDLQSLCSQLGISASSPDAMMERLNVLLDKSKEASSLANQLQTAKMDESMSNGKLLSFYMKYSGQDGFRNALANTKEAASIDSGIRSIEDSIRRSGLDPSVPECPVQWTDKGDESRLEALGREIGKLTQMMDAILDMTDLEDSMNVLASYKAERIEILKRGAVGLIAKELLDRSCGDAFGSVQPTVVSTADRYFRMMTGGACDLELDPTDGQLKVVGSDGARGEGKWSTGLRAQALLSVKLAIAKEMGGGEIPMILDDVLLTFDSTRKRGALKALKEVSSEMQILLFTCDSETREMAVEEGIAVMEMLPKTAGA